MDGYRVISSKKVSLCDIDVGEEQKIEGSLQAHVEKTLSGPTPFKKVKNEVLDLLSDDDNANQEIYFENNSSEILDFLTNNDSNVPIDADDVVSFENSVHLNNDAVNGIQQNRHSKKSFDSSTTPLHKNNSMQQDQNDVLRYDAVEYGSENFTIVNEAIENSCEIFTIDFIPSPKGSKNAIGLSDSDEISASEDAADTNGRPIIGFRRGKVPSDDDCFEQYISYLCPQCGINCGSVDKWKLHTETEHAFGLLETANFQSIAKNGKLCHKCRDCPKIVKLSKGFSELIHHRISHLPFRVYFTCRICSQGYRTKLTLKVHLKRDHKELNIIEKSRIEDSAIEHIRFICTVCKQEQKNRQEWRVHMRVQHDYFNETRSKYEHIGSEIYFCSVCNLKVRGCTLIEHMQTHDNVKSFVCTFCNASISQLRAALRHVRYKHLRAGNEYMWKCNLCTATFKTTFRRRKHYAKKHKIVAQICKVCSKTFDSSSSLLSHMNLANHFTLKTST